MARTSKALFAGMFLLVSVYGPAETATAAASRAPSANIYGSSAGAPFYAASKENQIGSRSRVAPNVKPIRTPGQCFRHCLRLKGTTEGFCYASCY
jgi:hypothetical protein